MKQMTHDMAVTTTACIGYKHQACQNHQMQISVVSMKQTPGTKPVGSRARVKMQSENGY